MDRFVPATDIEWRQAQEYGRSELFGSWDSDFNVKLSKQDKATMYAYRGKFRWGATESPSRRWVAIQSLDGILPERRGTILFDFQRSEGDHHLEVFEAASRRRIFRLDGQFCQVDPDSIWRPPSGWITEDILLVTFHERRLKTVILCRVP